MNKVLTTEIREVMEAVNYRPTVSLILPFDPKMGFKAEISYSLKVACDKVEKEIKDKYPGEAGMLVMKRLRALVNGLNFNTHKKSIAIYVSPLFEKVLYLDIPVQERIVVNDSFEIRDLVYAKKELHKYLVLLLSYNECKIYLGNSTTFVKIVSNPVKSIHSYVNDVPERIANFSDMQDRKEVLMDKFLHQIDNNLDIILNAYRLPLFVIGTKRISGHFKKLTRHGNKVLAYIHGNYEEADAHELLEVLKPHVSDWRSVINKDLMNRLDEAYGKNTLATGIKNVWREAMNNKGRLLVVEKNFTYAALHGARADVIYESIDPHNNVSYIHDAVDKVIEKVLESGGDVEFVDQDLLKDYGHIALLQYYS